MNNEAAPPIEVDDLIVLLLGAPSGSIPLTIGCERENPGRLLVSLRIVDAGRDELTRREAEERRPR